MSRRWSLLIFPWADGTRRYYLTDHLGSVRTVVDGTGTLVEARDYYPYGLELPGRMVQASPSTKEGFTRHEKDQATGLVYAGARYYMPAVPRWTAVDPLADKYPGLSPYNYVNGNPLSLVDPDGNEPIFPNKNTAQNVVADLNRVFSRVYGTDQAAFRVSSGTVTGEVPKRGFWNQLFGRTKQVEGHTIEVNSEFDFAGGEATETQRSYAGSLVEAVETSHDYEVRVSAEGEMPGPVGSAPLKPQKEDGALTGGQTPNSHTVLLAPGLYQDRDAGTGTGGNKWTHAGAFMHEVLYHLHQRGKSEGAQAMQKAFGFTLSGEHGSGSNHAIPSEEDRRND